ncbi:hypothetical protein [uncultured Mediterranean phage]|nr:hypothetical protein [uncultured Mediterranean phage]
MENVIWTPETTGLLVDITYKAVSKKIPILFRPLLKPALKIGIKTINKTGSKYVPDEVDVYINNAIVKAYNKDWEGASEDVGIAADTLINIPAIDDEHERKLFVSIAQAIVNGVKTWIEDKRTA